MSNIYYISGLGVDERIFSHLNLNGDSHNYIKWISPNKNESLKNYTMRLTNQISHKRSVILVGVSFGGIVAQEMAKIIQPDRTIIISSITNSNQLEKKMRLLASLGLHHLVPNKLLKLMNGKNGHLLMGPSSKEEKKLLQEINKDSDPKFTKWAIDKIVKWKGNSSETIFHIHGTKDKIFPPKRIKKSVNIEGGEHFMVVSKATEISEIINNKFKA